MLEYTFDVDEPTPERHSTRHDKVKTRLQDLQARPSCQKCITTGRACDGYEKLEVEASSRDLKLSNGERVLIPSNPSSIPSHVDEGELRAFDFFIHAVAPVLSGSVDDAFWFGPVLQISRVDPVIWDAVLTISCLFEYPQYSNLVTFGALTRSFLDKSHHIRALGWYGRAISRLQKSFEDGHGDLTVAMLSSVLFICIEFLQNNFSQSMAIYESSAKLMRSSSKKMSRSLVSALVEHKVSPIFTRLGVFGTICGPQTFPENKVQKRSTHTIATMRAALYTLMNEAHLFIFKATISKSSQELGQPNLSRLEEIQRQLISKMMEWRVELIRSGLHPDHAVSTDDAHAASMLLMYHTVTLAWLCLSFATSQTAWDQYNELFESVTHHAELGLLGLDAPFDGTQPYFTFEMGVIPPLYFAAVKCRSRRIRREALALIKRASVGDNVWKNIPTATIIAKVIEIEETNLPPYAGSSASDGLVPAEADRISEMTLLPEGEAAQQGEQRLIMGWRKIAHSKQWHFTAFDQFCRSNANPEGAPAFTGWSVLSSLTSNARAGSIAPDEWVQWPTGV